MQSRSRRPAILAFLTGLVVMLTAATQGQKFPGGVFKASDPSNNALALDFDSTGTLNVYLNNQAFAYGTWSVKADTMTFGKINGPEGYSCTSEAKYRWTFADNRLSFTAVSTDDCSIRSDPLLGLVWTKG